jgi:hypothetical protein
MYLGFNPYPDWDMWIHRHCLHIHCGIVVVEIQLPRVRPSQTRINRRHYGGCSRRAERTAYPGP